MKRITTVLFLAAVIGLCSTEASAQMGTSSHTPMIVPVVGWSPVYATMYMMDLANMAQQQYQFAVANDYSADEIRTRKIAWEVLETSSFEEVKSFVEDPQAELELTPNQDPTPVREAIVVVMEEVEKASAP
jgi:hypothetical protein